MDITPSLAIIVLNWNNYRDTAACIASLKQSQIPCQIIVVDNHSSESLRDIPNDPLVHYIQNKANLGYAGGNNTGIDYALAHGFQYIAILNNDMVVEPDFMRKCLDALGTYDIVTGHILRPDGTTYAQGGEIHYLIGTGTHLKRSESSITFVPGCAIVTKTEVFEKIGGFDERYFLYFEDTDWSARAHKAGFTCGLADTQAIHKVAATTGHFSRLYVYYMVRNQLLWISIHTPPLQRWLIAYPVYAVRTVGGYTILCLIRRRPRLILEIWHGVCDFWFNRFGPGKHLYTP